MKVFQFCVLVCGIAAELQDQLRYFEVLNHVDIKVRKKRSIDNPGKENKDVSFSAFGKKFDLVLSPGSPAIAGDFSAKLVYKDGSSSPLYVNQNDFYTGHLLGNKDIKADAYTEDGIWSANVYEKDEIYSLEPSWRHLPPSDNHSMIVYRTSDIKWNNIFPDIDKSPNKTVKICQSAHAEDDPEYVSVTEELLEQERENRKHIPRRERASVAQDTCPIIAVADYTFFTGPGGGFPHRTANYIIQAIQKVNAIYRRTVWNDELQLKGYGFQIKELRIHPELTDASQYHSNGQHYNMKNGTWPDNDLLTQFGLDKDFHNFCLAHLFTHRPFAGGVLGLAYIASPRKYANGGICSLIRNNPRAYNTGFSSTMNTKGSNLLTQEAVLVTAHGHNWGAEHDADTNECAPSSFNKGRFLMYPYAVSGYDENNDDFSPCSKRYITSVLQTRSSSCFRGKDFCHYLLGLEPETQSDRYTANVPMCGNGIIDKGEDCDSGGLGLTDRDPCCSSQCKFKGSATCSSTNFECCENCQMAPPGVMCRGRSVEQCQEAAYCSGLSLDCPLSPPIADSPVTKCIDEGYCKGGRCLDYCERQQIGLQPCLCTESGHECFRCCRSSNGTCRSYGDGKDHLADGRPCSFGYCVAGKCQKGKANMIQRLFSFIEQLDTSTLVAFMKSNIVGTIIVFSLVIWIPASWTVSCIDKRHVKKTRVYENRWVSNEALLNLSIQNTLLANQYKNYNVKEATHRRVEPYPGQRGARPDKARLPLLQSVAPPPHRVQPPEPKVTTTYKFKEQQEFETSI
ncbi:ADAM 17-like protease [Physella acuta]|uniref:ADAM 17-like protease n=1 Tax=Physella acuta TaxID=109671 RepID=UPI0027DE6040|nr:ADAM 17-like protease [Physella acuta]